MPVPPIVAVVGATASGKSELALDLAERLGGEVINTDAMAVYRGMDIGTAKLPDAERRGLPHHLLDLLDVTQPLTVAQFQTWARDCIDEVRGRGSTPVLVGGSALYVRAVVDRFEFAGTQDSVRRELEAELTSVGSAALHERLRELDPASADKILVGNGRRIVRALEVIALTGRPFSATLPRLEYVDSQTIQIGVAIAREDLVQRIDARVAAMFDQGFVDEVERLHSCGLRHGRTASKAIGYPEVTAYLDGQLTLAEAQERTVIATRRFARKQGGWFKKDPRIVWVDHDDPQRVPQALAAIGALAQT